MPLARHTAPRPGRTQVSVSLTLDPKKVAGAVEDELTQLSQELEKIAAVSFRKNLAILSLICNVEKTSEILMRVRLGA